MDQSTVKSKIFTWLSVIGHKIDFVTSRENGNTITDISLQDSRNELLIQWIQNRIDYDKCFVKEIAVTGPRLLFWIGKIMSQLPKSLKMFSHHKFPLFAKYNDFISNPPDL